jgi:hypothetical protein
MRLALLTGAAAALSLLGAAAAQAEMVYVDGPPVVETAPGYVYDAPAQVVVPNYATGYRVVPRDYVVVAPQPGYVVERPAPRETYRAIPRSEGVVTTGYSSTRTCMVDAFGFERCF